MNRHPQDEQLNRRIKCALRRLSQSRKVVLLVRLQIRLILLWVLCSFGHGRAKRAKVHWIGRHQRAKRYDRILFIVLYFGALAVLDPLDFMMWAIMWGGGLSIFLVLYTVYRFIPRKRAHWIYFM